MSLLFHENFQYYKEDENYLAKRWLDDSFNVLSSDSSHVGGPYLGGTLGPRIQTVIGDYSVTYDDGDGLLLPRTIIVGMYASGSQGNNITLYDQDNNVHCVVTSTRGRVFFKNNNGNTVVATSDYSYHVLTTWHFLEAKFYIDNTSGTVEIRVNNEPFISYTGDTQGSANNWVHRVSLGGGTLCKITNVYICDDSGNYNNDFLGNIASTGLFPNNTGTTNQFINSSGNTTNNHLYMNNNIGDGFASDGNFYVETSGDNIKDLFQITPTPSNVESIFALDTFTYSKKTERVLKNYIHLLNISGTDYSGELWYPSFNTDSVFSYFNDIFDNDPFNGTAWTKDTVDNLQIGFQLINYSDSLITGMAPTP